MCAVGLYPVEKCLIYDVCVHAQLKVKIVICVYQWDITEIHYRVLCTIIAGTLILSLCNGVSLVVVCMHGKTFRKFKVKQYSNGING